jgi:hypothetical protein
LQHSSALHQQQGSKRGIKVRQMHKADDAHSRRLSCGTATPCNIMQAACSSLQAACSSIVLLLLPLLSALTILLLRPMHSLLPLLILSASAPTAECCGCCQSRCSRHACCTASSTRCCPIRRHSPLPLLILLYSLQQCLQAGHVIQLVPQPDP